MSRMIIINITILLFNLINKNKCFSEIIIESSKYLPFNKMFQIQTTNTVTVSSNHTFEINTTNMNPECTPECYLNCQAQFPDIIQEKYCIINVCKCEIITESTTVNNKRQNSLLFLSKRIFDSKIKTDWSFITKTLWFIVLMAVYEISMISYYYLNKNRLEKEVKVNKNNDAKIHTKFDPLSQQLLCDEDRIKL